jgi:hydrogenase small subunit
MAPHVATKPTGDKPVTETFYEVLAPRIAHAMETKPRVPVLWLHGLECTCCSESFIRSAHPLVKDVVLSMISLDYDDTIMAASGHQAEAILEEIKHRSTRATTSSPSRATRRSTRTACTASWAAGRSSKLKEVCADAAAVISWGSCASWGCVQAAKPNPDRRDAGPQGDHRQADREGPGLPADRRGDDRRADLLLTFGELPELDRQGRPKMFYSQRIHDKCYRRAHFDAGQFAEVGRRRLAQGLLSLQDGLQRADHLQRLLDVRWNGGVVADPVGPRLHRLLGEGLLGQRAVLRAAENLTAVGVESTADTHRRHCRPSSASASQPTPGSRPCARPA